MTSVRSPGASRATAVLLAGSLVTVLLCGCVPVPYRPAVNIRHEAVTPEGASAMELKTEPAAWLGDIGDRLKREEPRIVFIDGGSSLPGVVDYVSLSDAMGALSRLPPGPAAPDFLLCLSEYTERVVHDSDYYLPLLGYGNTKYVARLPSLLANLRSGQAAQALTFESQYHMVVVQFVYGIMTAPRPQSAIHGALVAEFSRQLRAAQPTGPIRVLVMFQRAPGAGGSQASGSGTVAAPEIPTRADTSDHSER
ncbi:MAG TPA: hypothetical protein VMC02_04405 [Steroidobacteraceae bacterium]|nr:hypothetical protein [Steroidobacteraceae bacterium]